MRKLWISTGKNRFDKKWKNQEITWEELLRRFESPTRTQETQAEYLRMAKEDQDSIKDTGGFVGGVLRGGKRGALTVERRSLITLDADTAGQSLWDEIKLSGDFACAVYSTHKHRREAPRYRLVIPLDRDVSPDEYEAIARRVAAEYGIDQFDDTTFQPSRLMFWPSYSRDGEYFHDVAEGEPLKADEILAQYPDWKDVSAWPVSSRVDAVHKKTAEKQGDPTEKPGMVGAFCRAYDVPAAIGKFLPTVYADAGKDRYTYTGGSTSAGLVLYENGAFAYSNHSTDPAGGRLCNSFDLVRIHLFGEKDNRADPETPVNKLPSYKEMVSLAAHDSEVGRFITKEQMEEAKKEFEEDDEVSEADLERTEKGALRATIHNVAVLLRLNHDFDGVHMNLMADTIDIASKLPWGKASGIWLDADDVQLRAYLEKFGQFSRQVVYDGLQKVASDRAVHPVRDYLDRLAPWDGKPRLDTLLVNYLGAEDSEYVRQVTRKTLCAAVKRIYRPGCKFDTILVLNGPQGIGKSTLIQKLGGVWFNDSLTLSDSGTKVGAEKLQGYWILEIGELAGMRKADIETLRSFISRQDDVYRAAYARRTDRHPRQCIFIGTTNAEENGYLRDLQGNRRFWDVRVPGGDGLLGPWDLTEGDISQIWAEAKAVYEKGEELFLRGDVAIEAEERQRLALEADPREGQVQEYLDTLLPEDWYDRTIDGRIQWLESDLGKREDAEEEEKGTMLRTRVCNAEIWAECFCQQPGRMESRDSYAIANIMKKMDGWKKSEGLHRIKGYGRVRTYERNKWNNLG